MKFIPCVITCMAIAILSLVIESVSAGPELIHKNFWEELKIKILRKWGELQKADELRDKEKLNLLDIAIIVDETTLKLITENCQKAMWAGYFVVQSYTLSGDIEQPYYGIGFFITGVPDLDTNRKADEIWKGFFFTQKSPLRETDVEVKYDWEKHVKPELKPLLGFNSSNKTRVDIPPPQPPKKKKGIKAIVAAINGKQSGVQCADVLEALGELVTGS